MGGSTSWSAIGQRRHSVAKDLRTYLNKVRGMGSQYYVEATRPLSWKYEPCILQEKLAEQGRFPVIYCPRIEGSKIPLVTNLFGSYESLGLAIDTDGAADKPAILKEYIRREMEKQPVRPVSASEAPVKEIILTGDQADLGLLPIPLHQEKDAGRYINIGCMICKHPDTGMPNIGVYRHQVRSGNTLGAMLVPMHHAAYIARRYAELGKPMEVVVIVGHHPAVVIGSCGRGGGLHENELEIVGGVLGESIEVVRGETVDLPVPARAEIAIEGLINPEESITDGPFGEFTHYYGDEKKANLIHVTAITMRKDAIFHDLDNAHREHNYTVTLPNESHTYSAVQKVVPSLLAVHYPWTGVAEFHVYVSIKKRLQGEGKFAGMAALASNPGLKMAIVVDEDVNIYDEGDIMWAIATRLQADRGIDYVPFVEGESLDPASYGETRYEKGDMNTKCIVDVTKPIGVKFPERIMPPTKEWEAFRLADCLK
jgi:2,5-furandicarboxylate decarboxylase 1